MFLLDTILLSPLTGLVSIARKLQEAVEAERGNRRDQLMAELSRLHLAIEAEEIDEAEFNRREGELLDALDALDAAAAPVDQAPEVRGGGAGNAVREPGSPGIGTGSDKDPGGA